MDKSSPPGAALKPGGAFAPIAVARKGRGATSNEPHRFERVVREADGDALDAVLLEDEAPPAFKTEVTRERVKSLLAYNDSPDLGFDRSINPYRGCEHGCVYCYARPTHSYLNLSPGLDFETKLTAKVNAAEVLRKELASRTYRPAVVNIGSATDAYQPVERELRVTRGVLEVLAEAKHPLAIVTKSSLIERDIDLLAPLAKLGLVAVFVSVTTLDHELSRKLEPRAASPARRLRTVRALVEAGITVDVNFAPIIPFLNEPELEKVLEAAAQAGASAAHYTVLRLPWEVAPLFRDWLAAHYPKRAERVMHRVQDMRGGRDYSADFATRMKGDGLWAQLIRQRFDKACARFGLTRKPPTLRADLFEAPEPVDSPQLGLFG
jgi:DNA repair photolyase